MALVIIWVSRVQFGGKDVTIPMIIPVKWAGDTPVISVTDLGFPGLGNYTARVIDVKHDMATLTEPIEIADDGVFMLHPGEFVLGSTLERIGVPDDLVGRIEGKSSLGRLGLIIHSTAGFIDAGFDGHITLELTNIATLPITLYPRMKIGQVSFMQMTTPADKPYGSGARGSKYQGQRGPTPSRYFENFDS